ncbi:hypothetical protein CBOM_03324 [Ceraceosorus bombacis]|uniref:Nickel/cobalt efflux system n=1 Tax=Ceraceosorus bombacis TaxID=401625 RepID=A0A0P1BN25_9BASI|nr:hypothetical protein CBOM_03324 [Ceraceosorus bombacis]
MKRDLQSWRNKLSLDLPNFTLTLFGRSLLLGLVLLGINALLWTVCAILVTRRPAGPPETGAANGSVLSLALVAWTTGLRHGLDADHISLIDNACRRIMASPVRPNRPPRRPVTVGFFFACGHSTVVFVTTVVIAISVQVADHLDTFGDVGGIIGASVSGSTLLLIAIINSFILRKTWIKRKVALTEQHEKRPDNKATAQSKERTSMDEEAAKLHASEDAAHDSATHFNGVLTRLFKPFLHLLDRPWKCYFIGLAFGIGFDTASTIALLSVALVASQRSGGVAGSSGNVVLLALLFTSGMAAVDSADNILMVHAYSPAQKRPGQSRWALLERSEVLSTPSDEDKGVDPPTAQDQIVAETDTAVVSSPNGRHDAQQSERRNTTESSDAGQQPAGALQTSSTATTLSMTLTLLSICVAAAISIIVLIGLIGDECARCSRAADKQDETGDAGLEGRWWLAWRRANDNSGYIGAGIVGVFASCVVAYYVTRRLLRSRRMEVSAESEQAKGSLQLPT